MGTWFNYKYSIFDNEKVPFAKLNIASLAKTLFVEHVMNQNPITTRIGLMESLVLHSICVDTNDI